MNMKSIIVVLISLAIIGGVTSLALFLTRPPARTAVVRPTPPTTPTPIPIATPHNPSGSHATSPSHPPTDKPNLLDEGVENAKLSAEMRKLLTDLQEALDNDDSASVTRLCEKILKLQRERGDEAVPSVMRAKAIEALSWFLPNTLAPLVGFLADSDPEVLSDVISKLEDVFNDTSLGDRELSSVLSLVAQVLDNDDALDSLFLSIESDMRNSIAVETYIKILETGTQAAKDKVFSSIEDFTGEEGITTVEQLKEWLQANPDDEGDEEFYKGETDED